MYISALQKANDEGVDVRGYFLWTFLDNFEWDKGYTERFGIVHVDFATQKRIVKDSAFWYQKVIETNGAILSINTKQRPILFLEPVFKEMIWGGNRLRSLFGYDIPGEDTGECWAIGAHQNGDCVVKEGIFKGKTLSRLWKEDPYLFGNEEGDRFPLLIKIIDAKDNLSIQVHPDDAYAQVHENGSLGKTECWYILDCPEGAELVVGHNAKTKEELTEMISEGKWDEFIRRDGLEGFEKLPALSPATYRMRRLKDQYDLSTQEGRTEYAKACAQILKGLEPVELENHLQQLMVQTGFSREVLMAQIGQTVPRVNEAVQKPAAAAAVRRTPAADSTDDELRAQEMLISLLGTRRLPSDIISEQDFDDPLLKSLYTRLKAGDSPAALVDAFQDREDIRARVGRLLLTPPSEDTDQLIRMAEDCLSSLRRKRIERQIKTIMQNVNSMTGEEKREAMMQVQQLSAQLNQLKARRSTQP